MCGCSGESGVHDERTTRMKPGVVVLLAVLVLAAMVSAGLHGDVRVHRDRHGEH